MNEQIVIGIRGPKGEKLEFIDFPEGKGFDADGKELLGALLLAWNRYKKIPK